MRRLCGGNVTHFVPVTLCVMQKTRDILRLYGMTHNVTGTKCVMGRSYKFEFS